MLHMWSWWESPVHTHTHRRRETHLRTALAICTSWLWELSAAQNRGRFRTLDSSSAETCRTGGSDLSPQSDGRHESDSQICHLRVYECVRAIRESTLPTSTPHPLLHTYTYHPPRAILSVWKFGLHSWNPTKHCHPLIVIISLACSLTKKKPCNTNTSHLYGNARQYSPELWCIDLCYHYDNSHSHLTPHYTIESARGWI